MTERIEGTHHYATWSNDHHDNDGTFELYRMADDKQLIKWFWGNEQGPQDDAESAVEAFDESAEHFIAQGREERDNEINAAALKCGCFAVGHRRDCKVNLDYEPDEDYEDWQQREVADNFTAALEAASVAIDFGEPNVHVEIATAAYAELLRRVREIESLAVGKTADPQETLRLVTNALAALEAATEGER